MALRALFIDFNSYFASVEQQLNPELRGRPVGVLPVMADTTCCIAASYEAKAFGVKTGTRVFEAKQLCPDMVFVEAQHAKYVELHHQLIDIVDSCVPVKEVRSIDEMWCELIGSECQPERAIKIAEQIKSKITQQVGTCLTSSIGLAPNWFLAKIASNMQKPNGLTVLDQHNLHERMFALELRDIYGVGRRTEQRMHRAGINSVEALYSASKIKLRNVYNSVHGERLYDLLRGRQVYAAPTKRASLSHSHVLPPQLRNAEDALAVLHRLLQKASMRLRKMDYTCTELQLYVRLIDGPKASQTSTSYTPPRKHKYCRHTQFTETDDTRVLTHALQALWTELLTYIDGGLLVPSAVGVVLAGLVPIEVATGDLFMQHDQTKQRQLNQAIDKLNTRFGKNTVWYGGASKALNEAPMRIAFTHIPDVQTEQ